VKFEIVIYKEFTRVITVEAPNEDLAVGRAEKLSRSTSDQDVEREPSGEPEQYMVTGEVEEDSESA
jgi:hypothetical protein